MTKKFFKPPDPIRTETCYPWRVMLPPAEAEHFSRACQHFFDQGRLLGQELERRRVLKLLEGTRIRVDTPGAYDWFRKRVEDPHFGEDL